MLRVGVLGASGRMGSTVCRAVAADPELELVAAADPHNAGLDLHQVAGVDSSLQVDGSVEAFERVGVDVAVDFTVLSAARHNIEWCAANGVHAVVGTTGFTESDYAEIRAMFDRSNCLIAPNFAIGAVLMMRFAEIAAPFFESAEVIELHHEQKIDAPSGTAIRTVERMAQASKDWLADPTERWVLEGVRGARTRDINIHSVRLRGLVAHQEVLLGTTGQSLTIRHDSYDRDSFMPGVILAVKAVAGLPGLTLGLEPVLGI